jgi:hypothetical protein
LSLQRVVEQRDEPQLGISSFFFSFLFLSMTLPNSASRSGPGIGGSHRLLGVLKQVADIAQFSPSFDFINEGILKHEVPGLQWTLWAASKVEMFPAWKILLLVSSAVFTEEETTTVKKETPTGRAFTYNCR